ncbi:hypothetical protein PO909_024781 [Leuciscus waleckii]
MRSALLLVLLVTLMFTDGWDHKSQKNNAYDDFKRKHIISDDFDTGCRVGWAEYLTKKKLCGTDRPELQSFLSKNKEDSIKNICNGEGIRDRDNLCTSNKTFTVYTVTKKQQQPCEVVTIDAIERYVVVACDVIVNQCLPVHYQTQTNTPPNQNGQICKPPTYW